MNGLDIRQNTLSVYGGLLLLISFDGEEGEEAWRKGKEGGGEEKGMGEPEKKKKEKGGGMKMIVSGTTR